MEVGNFQQNQIQNNLNIPYDPQAPFELTLLPQEKGRIYGWIQLENLSSEELHAEIRFDLHQGFILTISDLEGRLLVEQPLKMHHTYQIQKQEEGWIITPKNA